MTLRLAFLALVLILAVRSDWRQRLIPNWLTGGGSVSVLILAFIESGWRGVAASLGGAFLLGGVFLIAWKLNMVGGGDQKLTFLVGGSVGSRWALTALVLIALAGGVQALLTVMWRRWQGGSAGVVAESSWRRTPLPYSLAIAVGAAATILFSIFKIPPLRLW